MKNYLLLAFVIGFFVACKETPNPLDTEEQDVVLPIAALEDSSLENAVIYEANIRQYSPEGTFDAFTKDIPKLKDLGVKIIWLMPVHPISMVKRKAENDSSVEDIDDPEERKKYLGSYYSIADYGAVNPDHGNMEDFAELVNTAHDNDMYVIMDWVPNHTGWDHPWITEHPEYYTKNQAGEITDPLNDQGEPWGWTDVADLNYQNVEMQEAMISEMKFWITERDVDGFRCDVAHSVPVEFWQKAIPELRKEKDIFMLAEAELPELMTNDLFEMSYAWEVHHILNAIAKGEQDVTAFDAYMKRYAERWEENDILMNFITNHDENSWAGPVKERMGEASEALLALTYCMPGMPLVYSGQEYDLDRRLKFFEKDTIPKEKGATWPLLEKLGHIKNTHPALHGGKEAASYDRITTSNDDKVLAFRRRGGNSEVIFVANLSDEPISFTMELDGSFEFLFNKSNLGFKRDFQHEYAPWEYEILIRN
ncbi:MAG: alpha-amylase family glycosyl hydrolase [Bacteroidota bacterium]